MAYYRAIVALAGLCGGAYRMISTTRVHCNEKTTNPASRTGARQQHENLNTQAASFDVNNGSAAVGCLTDEAHELWEAVDSGAACVISGRSWNEASLSTQHCGMTPVCFFSTCPLLCPDVRFFSVLAGHTPCGRHLSGRVPEVTTGGWGECGRIGLQLFNAVALCGSSWVSKVCQSAVGPWG